MVVAALATVEEPQPAIFVAVDDNDPNDPNSKNNNGPVGAELLEVEPIPITNSLRSTIRHLRARAGRWSRFRGFGIYMVWSVCRVILVSAFSAGAAPKRVFIRGFAQVAADVMLSGVSLTWIHTVISEPQSTVWFKRIPAYRTWVKFAPAVALKAVAGQIGIVLPVLLACALNLLRLDDEFISSVTDVSGNPPKPTPALLGGGMAVFCLSLALVILVEIPANVIMVRVGASLLPESVDSIVPFDRSFDGKVIPAVVGGSGKLGLMDAWKTFSFSGRIRLMKVLLKVAGMTFALTISFAFIYAGIIVMGLH